MKNKYVFLRHAETIKDPDVHPKDWLLTSDALEYLNTYISNGDFSAVTRIYSSTEPKAIATGKPISEYLNLKINEMEEFVEVKREKKFLTDEEFLLQKKREVENLESVENGISILEKIHEGETVLIISHGTVMTIYFAKLLGQLNKTFERWQKIKFCALGSVHNYKVMKDIIN